MPPKGYKLIGATLTKDWEIKVEKILEITREKPTEFFKRIIQTEYDKATGIESEASHDMLHSIEKRLAIMNKKLDSINETTKADSLYLKLIFGAISYCAKTILSTRY